MKGEKLLEKMELIDEKVIDEAEKYRLEGKEGAADSVAVREPRKRKQLRILLLAAAAVLLLAGTGITVGVIRKNNPKEETWPTKIMETGATDAAQLEETVQETMYEKSWEEMTITQRFREFTLSGRTYSVRAAVDASRAGEKLGDISLEGMDPFTGEMHTTEAEAFRMNGFSENAAVVLKYAESPETYCAISYEYKPETLGDFIEGVNLSEVLLVPGTAEYRYIDEAHQPHRIQFEGMTKEWLMAWLQKYGSAEFVDFDALMRVPELSVSAIDCTVGISEFGRENVSLYLIQGGYAWTNLFDVGICFHVGDEAVEEFDRHLKNDLQGYEYIRETLPADGEVETADGAETTVEETTAEE